MFVCLTLTGLVGKQRSSHWWCSVKNVFLEISQNSLENTNATVSFLIKLQAETCNFIKKRLWHRYYPVDFCEISKNSCFTEHPWVAASQATPTTGNSGVTSLETDFNCFRVSKFLACYLFVSYIIMPCYLLLNYIMMATWLIFWNANHAWCNISYNFFSIVLIFGGISASIVLLRTEHIIIWAKKCEISRNVLIIIFYQWRLQRLIYYLFSGSGDSGRSPSQK